VQVPLAKPLPDDLERLVLEELNVKEVRYEPAQQVGLETNITPVLRDEGWAREVIRALQGMRKEAGLKMGELARGTWHSDDADVAAALLEWSDAIAKESSLSTLTQQPAAKGMTVEKEFELAPGKPVLLGIAK
jgi:isoleucyl-tRNA synthetase